MWDDANEYEFYCAFFGVKPKCPGMWPYFMDAKHFFELKCLYQKYQDEETKK